MKPSYILYTALLDNLTVQTMQVHLAIINRQQLLLDFDILLHTPALEGHLEPILVPPKVANAIPG